MRQMSEVGREMLKFQEKLAAERGYTPVEIDLFLGDVREKYRNALPGWCRLDGDPSASLCSLDGTLLAVGYKRIVVGDYGAFVEVAPEYMRVENLRCQPGQEYRMNDERFSKNVKYFWLTAKDQSSCKIYFQKKTVSYADYVPGMFYISPYEVYEENKA